MAQSGRELLSIGAFFLIIAVAIALYAANVITDWTLIVSLVLVLSGFWFLVLAGLRVSKSGVYERSAFSTMTMGLLLIALSGAWYLFRFNWLYSLVLLLVAFGALAIATALRHE
jgi:hypothetical protein